MAVLAGCAAAKQPPYPSPTTEFYVNDFATILSPQDAQRIQQAGVRLQQATQAQVVLVTVDSLDGRTLEDYAIGLARAWGIGDETKDNGVLLLFTTDGPHTRIEVGYGLEGALPDSKAGRILDQRLVPWYDEQEAWSARLTDTYMALLNEVYTEYGLTQQEPVQAPDELSDEWSQGDWLIVLPFLVVLALALLSGRRRVFGGGFFGGPFMGGPPHGGFGGHSGGFRGGGGFGGGGGGFGGGGASR